MDFMTLAEPVRRRTSAAYLIAIALTLAEFACFWLYLDTLRDFPFLLPVTCITLAAFLCGSGPAALVAIVSEPFLQYNVIPPYRSFVLVWPTGYIGIAFYLLLCTIIIVLMHVVFQAHAEVQSTQASLRQLNEGLEKRVADRTETLVTAQRQLRDTNRNLERIVESRVGDLRVANEEIQRFAYIVSHDLRAPLVNVLGFTSELDAIRDDLLAFLRQVSETAPHLVTPDRRLAIEEDLPEALGFIRTSTQKMDRLINAILKLSRDGKRKLTPEEIDIGELVRAQGESLSQQLTARDAVLVIEGDLPGLVSDRLAIDQIFGNLIENAVKYLSPGRPGRIVVSARTEATRLHYAIADNGRGIAAKDFERVFELFRRAGDQDTPGEGIGLAYVRNLVRRLGGDVTLASEAGIGSTFTVILPPVTGAGDGASGVERETPSS